jgi:hypothetical protein
MDELQQKIKAGEGLEAFLGPLQLFINFYESGSYSKFMYSVNAAKEDLLGRTTIPGLMSQQWKGSKKGLTELSQSFTANPVEGAKYLHAEFDSALARNNIHLKKNAYPPELRLVDDRSFYIRADNFFPDRITSRSVSEYLYRSVGRIEMKGAFE